jgi:hypothetical protein
MRRLARTIVALLALALPASASASAYEPQIGVADQHPGVFADAYFRWSGMATARVMAPYDVALTDPAPLGRWLAAAAQAGVEPLVTFQHRDGEDCRKVACHLPTPGEYGRAIAAFHARWPHVTLISVFNEGNHPSQPTAGDPVAAARLYEAAVANCPGCRVIAAEVVDTSNMEPWLKKFLAALPVAPQMWGLHNYADVTRGETGRTARVLAMVPGQVWLTETGGIVSWVDDSGGVRYLYRWRAEPWESWDSGLLRPDATPRPSFDEVIERTARTMRVRLRAAHVKRIRRDRTRRLLVTVTLGPAAVVHTAVRVAPPRR